jgi:quinol monooxygenase YgiN
MNMTKNIRFNDKLDIGYEDIYKMFGNKKFFLMKINIPKDNKFIYLEHFNKHGKNVLIENWEHELLLPRNCKLKLTKKYDELFSQTLQSIKHKITDIIKDNVKYIPTRVYEFEYEGYTDKELIIPVIESVDMKKHLTKPENRALSVQVKDDIVKEMEKLQKKKFKNLFKVEDAKIVK